ncbi:MAG TPA: hypothetical protein VFI31_22420 [Pirellulales bacterium]|nr:hypothetical protein [Pirellulales bacterium]
MSAGNGVAAAIVWPLFLMEEGWGWFRQAASHRPVLPSFRGRRGRNSEGRLVQQLTRTITPDGADVIRGRLTVCIDCGSRTAAGHVAFCPPFGERPSFEIEAADQTVATLKVSQLYSHGARVEVRLPQLAQAETPVCIRFVAQARLAEAVPG